ncbi:hypothetical protein KAR91_61990 [Candidatus Pacearchaeota archaeon]|nr:hypothetical protein [Candidatus Pacearchaeota archaeon]
MKKVLVLFFVVLTLVTGLSATGQAPTFVPVVLPDMIEISFDGVLFQDASTYVSDIIVSTGTAAGNHIFHARRGMVIHFEAQLGNPYATDKVEWSLDTGLIPVSENKLYLRSQWGVEEPAGSGQYIRSGMSDPSEVVKLIGKPSKPRRDR